jgi:hypothetical protein
MQEDNMPSFNQLKSEIVARYTNIQPNEGKRRGVQVVLPSHVPGWMPQGVSVDFASNLGRFLAAEVGHPCSGVNNYIMGSFTRYGCSALADPTSPYYNAWVGCYVIFDDANVTHFGFKDDGSPIVDTLGAVAKSDQRIMLTGANCPHFFRFEMHDLRSSTLHDVDGEWLEFRSNIETWSEFHQGRNPGASSRFYLLFGSPPPGVAFDVEPFHPVTYAGTMLARYDPKLKATFCRFCNSARWTDRNGAVHSTEDLIGAQQREMLMNTHIVT